MQHLQVAIDSHTSAGVKAENQDACHYHIPVAKLLMHKGIAAVLADGVSASEKAKEASSCCVQGFLSDYFSTPYSWTTEHSASKVISALNNWLYSQSIRKYDHSSMLSTLSALIIKSNMAHIFHVGDSRVYHLRAGKLKQLTIDHVINLKGAKTYLSRAIGFDLQIHVDYKTVQVQLGDVFLLTSDGVHDYLTHTQIEALLAGAKSPEQIVEQALNAGSQDNISALICRVKQLPQQALTEAFDALTEHPIPPDLSAGMKINGFEIQALIQSSHRTQLYLARDLKTQQQVALKTPSVNFEDDPVYLKHFVYEQWVGQRIHSAHVVKVHSSAQDDRFLAYAMEYIKGETLRHWMGNHRDASMDVVRSIVSQIIQGMRAFHRQEMLHCDLKPENIMLSPMGEVKLIDFGSTRIAGVEELSNPIVTEYNQGTQGYSAPEAILDNQVSQVSDQFSLGVMVYEMLSGQLPYQDKLNPHLTRQKLTKIHYQSILEHNPHIPIWIDGALRKACHLEAGERYEALSEFLYDLSNPNQAFIVAQPRKKASSTLHRFRVLSVLSIALNIVLLLLLVR